LERTRFIPVRSDRIVTALLADGRLLAEKQEEFRQLASLYSNLYVLQLHADSQRLHQLYRPFDPDTEVVLRDELERHPERLTAELRVLLERANYRPLEAGDLEIALTEASPQGLAVSVDLSDFAQLELYHRGEKTVALQRRNWRRLWLRHHRHDVTHYERLFVLIQFKTSAERHEELIANGIAAAKARRKVARSRRALPVSAEDGYVFVRHFKDIPRLDLEALFPNRRIRMRTFDKVKLGITGGGGTVSSVVATATKVAAAASVYAVGGAIVGLALVIARQVQKIISQRTRYMAVLTRTLYFQNLENNFGAIARLTDAALDEEVKEVLLAWYFLSTQPPGHYTSTTLDRIVEDFVQQRFGIQVDYDVADGVRKLCEDGLLSVDTAGRLQPVTGVQARQRLESRWSRYLESGV
jgi:hypothetical protein